MPGLECKCGNIINYGEIPNPDEWLFISDVEYDGYCGLIDSEVLYKGMKSMLVCKRIWIFWDGFEKDPVGYFLEEDV